MVQGKGRMLTEMNRAGSLEQDPPNILPAATETEGPVARPATRRRRRRGGRGRSRPGGGPAAVGTQSEAQEQGEKPEGPAAPAEAGRGRARPATAQGPVSTEAPEREGSPEPGEAAGAPNRPPRRRRRRGRGGSQRSTEGAAGSDTVRTRVIEGFDDPSFDRAQWNNLVQNGETDVVFLTWEFQRAWCFEFHRSKLS